MTDYLTTAVPPPGYFIKEELAAREWTQRDLAYVLGIPEQGVNMILSGKRGISADMAKALGEAFNVQAEFFTNLQRRYDLSQARNPDPGVAKKARLQLKYPVREMIKRGWLADAQADLLEVQMARHFEKESTDEIPYFAHAAKKTNYDEAPAPQIAWLFRVRQIAKEMVGLRRYSEKSLREALIAFRRLMIDPEETRMVPKLLAECGVRYVIVEKLTNAKIDGVCFWIGESPVIGMSLQQDRIDNFWFVLRHEIEHVLLKHGRDEAIIDIDIEKDVINLSGPRTEEERLANVAAREFCVPKTEMDSFVGRKMTMPSDRDILGFARRLQIHPGIVAGQLRKRLDRWDIFSTMLVKIRPHVTSSAVVDGWGQIAQVKG